MRAVLYVDGNNFLGKLREVFREEHVTEPLWDRYDFESLFKQILGNLNLDEKRIYFARLKEHPETKEKSKTLIEERRRLKNRFEQAGFTVVLSGTVRGHYVRDLDGKSVLVFKEKGVDVGLAVDMVSTACDKNLITAIMASSDSDLQPAIRELTKRGVECIYLGFEIQPNKGLTYTTKRTILIRNSEALQFAPQRLV